MGMLGTIVRKELLQGLLTFRFAAALALMAVLWGSSLWIFVRDYQERSARSGRSERIRELEEEKLVHALMTRHLGMSAVVRPRRLSIFARGLEDEMVGTWKFAEETSFLPWRGVTRAGSGPLYENPARVFFPVPDAQTIIRVIGSLLALLFTYDGLSREREQGTLALCGVQAVPRDTLLLGKIAGSWCLLEGACLVAGGTALVAVLGGGEIGFTGEEWLRIGALMLVGGLYLLVFCGLGLALSAWCRETGAALLAALAAWVLLVLVGPGLARMVGEQVRPLESAAQFEGRKTRMAVAEYARVSREAPTVWSPTRESREVLEERVRKRRRAEAEMEEELRRRFARLERDFLPRVRGQEELVRALVRWSPAAHFLHLTQGLAGTSGTDTRRFREALDRHQRELNVYWLEKGRGLGWETPTTWEDAPRLALPAWNWRQWLADGLMDLGLLTGWAVGVFGLGVWGFRRMSLAPG